MLYSMLICGAGHRQQPQCLTARPAESKMSKSINHQSTVVIVTTVRSGLAKIHLVIDSSLARHFIVAAREGLTALVNFGNCGKLSLHL